MDGLASCAKARAEAMARVASTPCNRSPVMASITAGAGALRGRGAASLVEAAGTTRYTARPPLARVNAATARVLGLVEGEQATISTERGSITLPVVFADLPDGVVWLPAHSAGSQVRVTLGVGHGDLVGVSR